MTSETGFTVWCIYAGRTGNAEALFRGYKVVALGWPKMGNLGVLPADRESYKMKILEACPSTKE